MASPVWGPRRYKLLKMKKTILKLTLVAALFASAPAVYASGEQPEGMEERVVTVVENGEETIINVDGTEYILDSEEYQAELGRGLTPQKIANNKRISEADSAGVGVTIMAMCIVLGALIVLSVLFMFFGKLFTRSHSMKKREAHGVHPDDESHDDSLAPGEVIAAIGAALDEHFNSRHDMEDTVLTIRRMKRAYSPWNSKIYNMRELPSLRKK